MAISNTPSVTPQRVRWGPSDARPAGIRVWNVDGAEDQFVPWATLQDELSRHLLPQLFANPAGFSFETRDYNGKIEWLVQVFQDEDEAYCDVWFGDNPDAGWQFDGLVRVGDANNPPHAWQTYQRYSDGTYRRLESLVPTIDEYSRGRGPIGIRRPSMP